MLFRSLSTVPITSSDPFPFDSPSHSFYVVDTPVTYQWNSATQTLTRYWNYPIVSGTPDLAAGSSAVLAQNVTNCLFDYAPGISARSGLVSVQLSIAQSGETITLYNDVHVTNVP